MSATDSVKRAKKDEDAKDDDDNGPNIGCLRNPSYLLSEPEKSPEQYYHTENYASNCTAVRKPEALIFSASAFVSPRHRGSSC